MNNPLCQETQTALLTRQEAGAALPPQAVDHLKECQECRKFQETLSLLLPPAPPRELDEAVREQCHTSLRFTRWRRRLRPALWTSAAAALLLAGSLFLHHSAKPAPDMPSRQAAQPPRHEDSWEEVMLLDTEFSLANADLSSLELQLDLLVADLY